MGTGPTSGYETDPDEMDWVQVYQDPAYLNHLSGALVHFSAERFKSARIIQNLSQLEAIHHHIRSKIVTMEVGAQALLPFMMDWLIDEIRICLFFENLWKAELLSQGYVIHMFQGHSNRNPDKGKILHRAQQDSPIPVARLVSDGITDELMSKTITMEMMTRPKYQTVIQTPLDILAVVKRFNENRNKLHFTSEVGGELSGKGINDLKLLDAYVNQTLQRISKPGQST